MTLDDVSRDPDRPTTIVVQRRCEIGVYEHQCIVMPGEIVLAYRTDNGIIVVGFEEVTLQ